MKRIKDIACISRPSANIRIKSAIMLLERYCFLNIQRYIIPISTPIPAGRKKRGSGSLRSL